MDLALRGEDKEMVAALDALLTKHSSPTDVRAAEPLGFDPDLWQALVRTGVPGLAVGEDAADLRQLALVAEVAGRHLASAPVVETVVTARLLERHGAMELAEAVAEGTVFTIELQPAVGTCSYLLPAGAVASGVIRLDGDRLVLVLASAPHAATPNLGSLPLADRDLTGGRVVELATGTAALAAYETARSEWQLLTAAQLVGLASRALEIGVAYVKQREIFGRAVGSFQTIAHCLADDATALDGARLLVQEAAWAADTARAESAALASMAFCDAAEQALMATGDSLHFHGGYGFTLEYDIQLFHRRAKAWPLVWGSLGSEYQRLAGLLLDSPGPAADPISDPAPSSNSGISFDLPDEVEAFRAEVAAFLDEHLTPALRERVRASGSLHDWDVHRALGERGWIAPAWPEAYGGQDRDPLEMMAMREEMKARHYPSEGLGMTLLVARAVRDFGSRGLAADIVPRALRGEILMCLGYSETHGGSDVASARTLAVRDGDDWVINGQKVFTTLAEEATYVFLLTRTNPDAPKHKGLTMFLVPMDSPGVQIDEIRTLGGERTNQTFYTDVRVADSMRVGQVDGGWQVLLAALTYERSGVGRDDRLHTEIVAATRRSGAVEQPYVREQLARHAIATEVAGLLGRRSCWVDSIGEVPTVEGSMHKLFSAESKVRWSSVLLDLLGPDGLREVGDPASPADGDLVEEFRHAVILPIYGGASEVQRRIIAERHLGLPRTT